MPSIAFGNIHKAREQAATNRAVVFESPLGTGLVGFERLGTASRLAK